MTDLLVSVTSVEEALAALQAGAKVIDLKDPSAGALGRLPDTVVAAVLAAVGGQALVTAAAGDAPTVDDARALAATGVPVVKVPVPAGDGGAPFLKRFGEALGTATRLVAVFAADREPDVDLVAVAAASGFGGVMLDTVEKTGGLLKAMDLPAIGRFVAAARREGLMVGLAGSLKVGDVGTLLPFRPDVIGFRGGVCEDGDRTRPLDPSRVRAVVAAIAVHALKRDVAAE